ncbi:DUF1909-domain-containing protein [Cladorrhinum sp. PSN259]|nr:DUF1909-domain-containing protein [Cladorrhinum sp. PSN259]
MGGGNGAKAAQKRARNAKAGAPKAASQLKSNEAAKTNICQVCRQAMQSTANQAQLELHAKNKHEKELGDCFPNYQK